MIGKKRQEEATGEEDKKSKGEEDKKSKGEARLYGFRAVYVFDGLSRDLWPSPRVLDGLRH